MAIYAYDQEIELTAARMIPVWIEKKPGEIKWHYSKPAKVGKQSVVTVEPIWHIKATWKDNGAALNDGKWGSLAGIVADDGIQEIIAECNRLSPSERERFEAWNKKGAPDAPHFFDPIEAKEVA